MRKPLNKGGKGDEFLPLETLEDFANLDALTPQPVRSASVIPFVLAGFVLVLGVAIAGNYLAQNASARTVPLASLTNIENNSVSLVGKSAFLAEEIDLDSQGYAYDIGQQATASLKGDMIDNVTVVHRSVARADTHKTLRRLKTAANNSDVVITPASARANEPLSSSTLTPSIRKLESVWRMGRDLRKKSARRGNVNANEHFCLAKAIYFEARSESKAGKLAVANVVMNRVKSKNYPSTICGVVYENRSKSKLSGCQFSFTCDGRDDKPRKGKQWNKSKKLATSVLKGHKNTRVVNASVLHYHADYVRPKWSFMMRRLTKIGRHIFYTGS